MDNNELMYRYQAHLLLQTNDRSEKDRQRDKRYCDGSMQRYLEERWAREDSVTKKKLVSSFSMDA